MKPTVYQLLTMVNTRGTQTCVHLHVSHPEMGPNVLVLKCTRTHEYF